MMESNKQKFYQKSSFYVAVFAALVLVAGILIFTLIRNNNTAAVNGGNVANGAFEKGENVDEGQDVGVENGEKAEEDVSVVFTDENMELDVSVIANSPEIKNLTEPVEGEVIYQFRKPITDKTDKTNKTPRGVGIKCELDSEVKSSSEGVVEFIGVDKLFGTTVVINHGDMFKTIYSNLNDEVKVSVGDEVKVGDVIGNIGESAVYFVNAHYDPHLHFEIIASNEKYEDIMANYNKYYDTFVNPLDYLDFSN
ncbi:M23 family metallopeptidase [Oceanirhabdus sp. W0125-5]|uniref:M23 family metallopeptidase n=1 Tax=Oceanirhabdus sp. W0125-5 TaxID=2999116 RepID=UPI0022F32FCF|nr:M23 family metallopeptidase [Oceanirhabdus sp. W0125-5]WBW98499.1 M23 family metallopeptidase [Oceanirhabdus sp. W0125-5]